jgi:glyoxylase-like metal-dependent hydrolase (beta-lactamase superfamily II)
MLTEVEMPDGPVVFAGDLVPGVPWVHLPITMGYDRYPEMLIDEKRALFEALVPRGLRLFFTHDPETALAKVELGERERYSAGEGLAEPRDLAR